MFAGFEKSERPALLLLALGILAGAVMWSRSPEPAPLAVAAGPGVEEHAAGALPAPPRRAAAGVALAPGGRIDLNTATAAELELLPGVGPSKSAAIIEDRSANGPFRSVADLDRVPGFGPKSVERLAPFLAVGVVAGAEAPSATPVPSAVPQAAPAAAPVAPLPIRINHAGSAELEGLAGVGPALARRIVEDRAARGPFRTARDLQRVKGIGPSIIEKNAGRMIFD